MHKSKGGIVVFYDIYINLCKEKGISPSKAAAEIGIDRSNVTHWKNRGLTPRGDALQKISEYFGVTVDELISGEQQKTPTPEGMSARKKSLIDFVDSLSDDEIQKLYDIAKVMHPDKIQDK